MASLNKTSIREEFDKLKSDFEQLRLEGKVPAETQALIKSLYMMVELILAIFLERQTRKTSRNSSLPSSQTDKDETALTHAGSNQRRKEPSETAGNSRRQESVTIATVETCDVCGQSLAGIECIEYERRTKIDILFEKVVEHIDAQVKHCPVCHSTVKGLFPAHWHGPLQYGDGLKAFAVNLLVNQMVSLERSQRLIESMIGQSLSEATLLKFVLRLHQALEGWEASAIARLQVMPSMHVDETSFRVDGKNHWIHVYAAGDITLKRLHRKRGKEAIKDIDIIPKYGGTIIHDCWASYLSYEACSHGLCGSHLLRELTFVVDSNGYAWAGNMKRLLQETCVAVAERQEKSLNDKELANLQKRYRNILTRGQKELPPIPPKPSGKPGKPAKSDAHNLWERFKQYEVSVLLFAREPHVPFTNNRAERDLRMAKVKQKVSGCFRTEQYAQAYCRISSYLQTMAYKGHNPLIAIQMALAGKVESD